MTHEEFGDRALEACLRHFGDLHILVNNAGYVWNSRIVNHTDEQWYAMLDVHATGPFRLLRAAGRHFQQMASEGRAARVRKVVNVSSISGLFGAPTQFSYSAAKSALVGMTRSLAKDWGRWNVTVNCVAFGFIQTRLTQTFEGEPPRVEVGNRSFKVGVDAAQAELLKQPDPARPRRHAGGSGGRGLPLLPAGIGLRQRRGPGRGRRPADVKRLSRAGYQLGRIRRSEACRTQLRIAWSEGSNFDSQLLGICARYERGQPARAPLGSRGRASGDRSRRRVIGSPPPEVGP